MRIYTSIRDAFDELKFKCIGPHTGLVALKALFQDTVAPMDDDLCSERRAMWKVDCQHCVGWVICLLVCEVLEEGFYT